jgi:hypothetical protein
MSSFEPALETGPYDWTRALIKDKFSSILAMWLPNFTLRSNKKIHSVNLLPKEKRNSLQ